jgi:hypothetical protein
LKVTGDHGLASIFVRLGCLAVVAALSSRPSPSQQVGEPVSTPSSSQTVTATPVRNQPASALLTGLNAGVTLSGVHDSSVGWYNVVTPGISYSLAPHYSVDASMSIFPYKYSRQELVANPGAATSFSDQLIFDGGDVGDLLIEGHGIFNPRFARNIVTVAITLPTGNRSAGLGTGRVTFSVDDRLERYFGNTGFVVDIGGGDSNSLVNRLVTQDDTSLGPLAQFQAGVVAWFPRRISLQSVAYEQLPLGDQKTYATVPGPGPSPSASTASMY